jgi:hypothetical protein
VQLQDDGLHRFGCSCDIFLEETFLMRNSHLVCYLIFVSLLDFCDLFFRSSRCCSRSVRPAILWCQRHWCLYGFGGCCHLLRFRPQQEDESWGTVTERKKERSHGFIHCYHG